MKLYIRIHILPCYWSQVGGDALASELMNEAFDKL